MTSTRFIDHLPTGEHAGRPAYDAVPQGTLYACSTHGLIYQSDGASAWSTWATLGGDVAGAISAHAGDADAHHTWPLTDDDIPSGIARDSEVTSAIGGTKLDDLATPDDTTDLDATTSRHGLLPKLGGGTSNYLRADGSWATPPGGGGGGEAPPALRVYLYSTFR